MAFKELKEKISTNRITKISRWLFGGLIVVSLAIFVIIGFYLYQGFVGRDVFFFLEAPRHTLLGTPFDIKMVAENKTDNFLKDVKLSMILPEGVFLVGESPEKRVFSKNVGDLAPQSSLQENVSLLILENEQSIKQFEVFLSYFPPALGPKARFEQKRVVEVSVGEPAIKLDLFAPQKVLNNEDFEVEIHYQNLSEINFSNVELSLVYPDIFTFKKASPQPLSGNNFWKISDLTKNNPSGSLIIQGKVIGAEKSFFKIEGLLSVDFSGQKYLINKKIAEINIAPSPLSLNIIPLTAVSNDQLDYLTFPNENLRYRINYYNNSDVGLNDLVIKAKLTGEMFDFPTLRSAGFFNSKDNTITWNVANTPDLRLINPRSGGFVEFEIKTKYFYPIKRVSDKNFILKVEAEISSPTVPYYVAAERTIGLAELKTKVVGRIEVGSRASFLRGSWPPKVNQPTIFTIRWLITNYSTDVKNIEVKAFLQSGSRWLGQTESNVDTKPVYNERTQEVTWLIDRIPATKGVISKPVEASFQIEATPNITQVSRLIPLLSETTIRGFDTFANIELKNSANPLSSEALVFE